jgi:hypothetical protein
MSSRIRSFSAESWALASAESPSSRAEDSTTTAINGFSHVVSIVTMLQ